MSEKAVEISNQDHFWFGETTVTTVVAAALVLGLTVPNERVTSMSDGVHSTFTVNRTKN